MEPVYSPYFSKNMTEHMNGQKISQLIELQLWVEKFQWTL